MKPLRTSDVARATGTHPNTVRKYEEQGFLPRTQRGANGYRQFTERHIEQVGLVLVLMRCSLLGERFKEKALATARYSADGEFAHARETAETLLALVKEERDRAEAAAELLADWAGSQAPGSAIPERMTIKETAAFLNVTAHTLRNWDRNRLLQVPRCPESGYRTYGPAEVRRLMVIRALRRARYNVMSILHMFRQLEADSRIDPRAALDSLPPGEQDIYHNTYRWLTRVREFEGYAREALERLDAITQRYA